MGNEIREECKDYYETIYIGGGTPTCLSDEQFDRLLSMIDPYANDVSEYTIEANPESLNENKINILKNHHINRISLGVQTSDNDLLKSLNRKHTFEDVVRCISLLKDNGIDNISVDLMYSLPGQTMEILKKSIDDILSLDTDHISIYSLTVEENTVFGKKNIEKLDDDTEGEMYEYIIKTLEDNGYINYEISNFARNNKISRHNLGYWNYEDFLGISAGAASKIGNRRYQITGNIHKYLEDYHIYDEDIILGKREMMFENIMMSLRTVYGLNINEFNKRYECDFREEYKEALKNELISIENGICYCTNRALLNQVLMDFMD